MSSTGFQLHPPETDGGSRRVRISGALTLDDAGSLRRGLVQALGSEERTELDLGDVEHIEGAAAAILAQSWGDAVCEGRALTFTHAKGPVREILDLYTARVAQDCLREPPQREPIVQQVGRESYRLFQTIVEVLDFLGRLGRSVGWAVRRPSTVRWADVTRLGERHGADGVPITLMIGFLIGLITAFQAAVQLAKFGADVFMAELLSISITRELGPLMTAIVLAGRSGAAIAAELGTMKVGEEVDALDTLGLDPMRFLVLPRILAVSLVAPLLTLLCDVVGVGAGLLIAVVQLDLGWQGFLISIESALSFSDVFGGLFKAWVFGIIIATLACERGLATRGGAEGVGRATTGAVVAILFHLIAADAMFAMLFNLWGI